MSMGPNPDLTGALTAMPVCVACNAGQSSRGVASFNNYDGNYNTPGDPEDDCPNCDQGANDLMGQGRDWPGPNVLSLG
jgi:hypothetical protein